VQLLARVEEMLQRYRSLRCRDDVNVFALGPSSGCQHQKLTRNIYLRHKEANEAIRRKQDKEREAAGKRMRYGPGTEELALRIDNLVQLLARVEEMLQR
jgi:hypothetical protein